MVLNLSNYLLETDVIAGSQSYGRWPGAERFRIRATPSRTNALSYWLDKCLLYCLIPAYESCLGRLKCGDAKGGKYLFSTEWATTLGLLRKM